ncbi:MAG: DUF1176 domain-containing protein, partial [Pseudomonadota bacterium]
LGTASAAVAQGPHFQHKDWEVVCDNTGTCRAVGYYCMDCVTPETYETAPISLKLTRDAGAHAPIRAMVRIWEFDPSEPDTDRPKLTLYIDNERIEDIPILGADAIGTLSKQAVTHVVHALRGSTDITFRNGPFTRHLSDAGSAAALLFMDEYQGRLGTVDAAIRVGRAPSAQAFPSTPAPLIIPKPVTPNRDDDPALFEQVIAAITPQIDAHLKQGDQCHRYFQSQKDGKPMLHMQRLSDDTLLLGVPCWLAAYNAGQAYFTVSDRPPYDFQRITLNASDYRTGTIYEIHKGRGLGDCWSGLEYIWDGTTFALSSGWTTGRCAGFAGGTWHLPTYVSRSQP